MLDYGSTMLSQPQESKTWLASSLQFSDPIKSSKKLPAYNEA